MSRIKLMIAAMLFSTTATAGAVEIPPDKTREFQQAAASLVIADGCNRKLKRPEIFTDAKAAFLKFVKSINMPDPEAFTDKAAAGVANAPWGEEPAGFDFFTEKRCGELAKALKAELAK